jgi:hypothetical protein
MPKVAPLPERRSSSASGATPFRAEVEVDTDALAPDTPPPYLIGTFIRFDGYETVCKALVHTDRFDGGSSHTMYLCDGRHGYRFTMAAPGSERFEAVAL